MFRLYSVILTSVQDHLGLVHPHVSLFRLRKPVQLHYSLLPLKQVWILNSAVVNLYEAYVLPSCVQPTNTTIIQS